MVAGTLSQSGYFMGDRPLKVTDANPKGYFEDAEINSINEDILDSVAPKRPPLLGRWFCLNRAQYSNRWVARIPLGVEIAASASTMARIRNCVTREPFCFKDPRFCYSLPAWRSSLRDTVFVCVFRPPAVRFRRTKRQHKRAGHDQ